MSDELDKVLQDILADVESEYQKENKDKPICDHGVVFNEQDAEHLSSQEIQKKYPRGFGPCPKGCGFSGIAYASYLHYIAGDW